MQDCRAQQDYQKAQAKELNSWKTYKNNVNEKSRRKSLVPYDGIDDRLDLAASRYQLDMTMIWEMDMKSQHTEAKSKLEGREM